MEIDTNVILEGNVVLGERVKIGAGCVIKNSTIGDDCEISPYSVVEDAHLQAACTIGPFARLRPGAELLEGAGQGANHTVILRRVHGMRHAFLEHADGANKFKTIIGDDVFVGSDTQLVAPVTVGKGVTIAAGTTVTRDIADNELVLSRVPQVHKQGWQRPVKKK